MHIQPSQQRAFLDGELLEAERAAVEAHLGECPECRQQVAGGHARARRVGERLSVLSASASLDEAPEPADRAYAKLRVRTREEKVSMLKTFSTRRPLWAGLALALVMAVALSFAPVRTWAGQFLGLFRVEQIAVFPVDFDRLESLMGGDATLADQMGELFANSVDVTREPGPELTAADAAEASQLAGYPVRLLAEGQPRLHVQNNGAFEMVIDRERAQALLDGAGRTDLQLPASIDGAKIEVDMPTAVTAEYGDCGEGEPEGQPPRTCVVLVQAPSPSVVTPPDFDIAALAELGLQFIGMTAEEARAFSSTIDWTSTLVLPIPTDAAGYQQVSVDGVTGTIITGRGRGGTPPFSLMWVKDGMLYSLSGFGSADEAVALADGLK